MLVNRCSVKVEAALACVLKEQWYYKGWYYLEPGTTAYVADSDSKYIYPWAQTVDKAYGWNGKTYDGGCPQYPKATQFRIEAGGDVLCATGLPGSKGSEDTMIYFSCPPSLQQTPDYKSVSGGILAVGALNVYQIHIKNEFQDTYHIALKYHELGGDWKTEAWWDVAPGEGKYVARTDNPTFYFFGETDEFVVGDTHKKCWTSRQEDNGGYLPVDPIAKTTKLFWQLQILLEGTSRGATRYQACVQLNLHRL